ncbi:MAG: hypothetical protein PUP93_06685 [Rhizonema sp. NSF051]|nr:hypothetical protein [Rhizonema sp. NSF051]
MLKPQFLLTNKIPLTIYRKGQGSYVDGDWVTGPDTEVNIQVNIQPLKSYEIQMMPESDRTRVWYRFYSADYARTLKESSSGWQADEFVWKGDRYKIMKVDDWTNGMSILEHVKVYAARIELTPN